jgi:hypothetical protein
LTKEIFTNVVARKKLLARLVDVPRRKNDGQKVCLDTWLVKCLTNIPKAKLVQNAKPKSLPVLTICVSCGGTG